MAYSSGFMNKRITIARRSADASDSFGKANSPKYEILGEFWSAEDFNKGVKSLREGALDAYDTVMFRMRYNADIDRWCLIKFRGKWYQITSFQEDYRDNQVQILATEMVDKDVNLIEASIIPRGALMDCDGLLLRDRYGVYLTADNN